MVAVWFVFVLVFVFFFSCFGVHSGLPVYVNSNIMNILNLNIMTSTTHHTLARICDSNSRRPCASHSKSKSDFRGTLKYTLKAFLVKMFTDLNRHQGRHPFLFLTFKKTDWRFWQILDSTRCLPTLQNWKLEELWPPNSQPLLLCLLLPTKSPHPYSTTTNSSAQSATTPPSPQWKPKVCAMVIRVACLYPRSMRPKER